MCDKVRLLANPIRSQYRFTTPTTRRGLGFTSVGIKTVTLIQGTYPRVGPPLGVRVCVAMCDNVRLLAMPIRSQYRLTTPTPRRGLGFTSVGIQTVTLIQGTYPCAGPLQG